MAQAHDCKSWDMGSNPIVGFYAVVAELADADVLEASDLVTESSSLSYGTVSMAEWSCT